MSQSSVSIPIKQLASYCLDYAQLVSGKSINRTGSVETPLIPCSICGALELFTGNGNDMSFKLRVKKLPEEGVLTEEELAKNAEENKQIEKEIRIANKIDDLVIKSKTNSYTKQVALQTGFVNFTARRLKTNSLGQSVDSGDLDDIRNMPLFQLIVTLSVKHESSAAVVEVEPVDGSIKVLLDQFNKYLPSAEYDELFGYMVKFESSDANTLPVKLKDLCDVWSQIAFHLNKQEDCSGVSDAPDFKNAKIALTQKVNYFLSEDLRSLVECDEDELGDTSLGAWSSDKDMDIEECAEDDGSTEIFFPFPYDKYQLNVLGILKNKSVVVEGPPGTGKSQTIANLLVHLAATGNKVLFASQKDQAIRGVKDKLKTLGIRFLFGYIPDRQSKLHTDEDDKDSATNVLMSINDEVSRVEQLDDHKFLIKEISLNRNRISDEVDGQRKIYALIQGMRKLDNVRRFAETNVTKDYADTLNEQQVHIEDIRRKIADMEQSAAPLKDCKKYADAGFDSAYDQFVGYIQKTRTKMEDDAVLAEIRQKSGNDFSSLKELFGGVDPDNSKVDQICNRLDELARDLDEILPDGRVNLLKHVTLFAKVRGVYNRFASEVYEEVYREVKNILFDRSTSKSVKLRRIREMSDYFNYRVALSNVEFDNRAICMARANIAKKLGGEADNTLLAEFLGDFANIERLHQYAEIHSNLDHLNADLAGVTGKYKETMKLAGLDEQILYDLNSLVNETSSAVFDDIDKYRELSDQLKELRQKSPQSVNQLREEINEMRALYRNDITNYVQNRIVANIESLKAHKNTSARLARIARGLARSNKAYKTFDKLKSDPDNFAAMTEALPIWMMGLDDVNRIVPNVAGCFDYVIIDEASQCNMAYALPTMYRAKHTIFFGDTRQMRDTNTLFKSNEQLESIAKKNGIPGDYQIKAEEDSVKSVMDIAELAGFKTVTLKNHYRSPKQLIGFSNDNFYEKIGRRLEVINNVIVKYKNTDRIMLNHVIDVKPEVEMSDKTNMSEVIYIKNLINDIRSDTKLLGKSIAVLTFFNDQADLLQRELDDYDNVKVSTIEGIQGDERDIVIYSFVITDPKEGKRKYLAMTGEGGALRADANAGRVNVAFSRAREQVHCVTSIPIDLWPEGIWIKKYLQYVDEHGSVAYQHQFNEQHFDSKFEEDIYGYLASFLSPNKYMIQTQVKSCGFKIDQVIVDMETGRKLAIECDGPTHFERGDGQVYVQNDYERQFVLESAGWNFYRISYGDWVEDCESTKSEIKDYVYAYFASNNVKTGVASIVDTLGLKDRLYVPKGKELPKYVASMNNGVNAVSDNRGKQIHKHTIDTRTYKVPPLVKAADNATTVNSTVQSNSKDSNVEAVDQVELEKYLRHRVGEYITIKYVPVTSPKSAKLYSMKLYKYDTTYIYSRADGYTVRYRRDRVTGFGDNIDYIEL